MLIKKVKSLIIKLYYRFGKSKKCIICNKPVRDFMPYNIGRQKPSAFTSRIDTVGSDVNNFSCPICRSTDRERHLILYLEALNIAYVFADSKILHFAPEYNLKKIILNKPCKEYIQADLFPQNTDIKKIDACDIKYDDNYFDLVIFNHILEHIPDYKKAISELYRILKKGGYLIAQTPYSNLLKDNFEEEFINNDSDRIYFYGQADHVRKFSKSSLIKSFSEAGFQVQVYSHENLLNEIDPKYFGVNAKEDFFLITK